MYKVLGNFLAFRCSALVSVSPQGITFEEMESLQNFLSNVNDINTALSFYHVAGADIDPGESRKRVLETLIS